MGFITGWLVLGAYQLYYSALRIAEASLVSTLFQFILPINYVLGLVFFNEKITLLQFLGLVIIVTSATVLAAEEREDKWVVNKKVIGLMILASLCISVSDALFKGVAEHNSYITLAITEYSSTLIAGFLLYAILPNIRKELKNLRGTYKKLSIIAFSNEFFTTVGNFSLRYALLLGPIALVQGMMGAQPFFVLGIAALLALFFPHLRQHKKKTKKRFRTELVAMASVVIGVYLITAQ